jgi:hypothetical protein
LPRLRIDPGRRRTHDLDRAIQHHLAHDFAAVEMHRRYVNLKPGDVAKGFGICSHGVHTDSPPQKPSL